MTANIGYNSPTSSQLWPCDTANNHAMMKVISFITSLMMLNQSNECLWSREYDWCLVSVDVANNLSCCDFICNHAMTRFETFEWNAEISKLQFSRETEISKFLRNIIFGQSEGVCQDGSTNINRGSRSSCDAATLSPSSDLLWSSSLLTATNCFVSCFYFMIKSLLSIPCCHVSVFPQPSKSTYVPLTEVLVLESHCVDRSTYLKSFYLLNGLSVFSLRREWDEEEVMKSYYRKNSYRRLQELA
jgi:hypothetical protein